MFQYALGRILAERFEYALAAEPISLFPNTHRKISGDEYLGAPVFWYGNWPVTQEGKVLNVDALHSPPGTRLVLRGSFMRFQLFQSAREKIRSDWFRLRQRLEPRPDSDFAISLITSPHPSEGKWPATTSRFFEERDYYNTETIDQEALLSVEEIRQLAKLVPHEHLYLLVDFPPPDSLRKSLADLRPTYVTGTSSELFFFLESFRKIAISQSADHWWAAFLSQANLIFFPRCDRGYWSRPSVPLLAHEPSHHGIDLRVDEERYIYNW